MLPFIVCRMRAGTVIGICCNLACLLSALLAPYMPNVSRQIRTQLGLDASSYGYIPDIITNILPTGHKIGKPSPLFKKIEEKEAETLRQKYAGKQETKNDAQKNNDNDVKSLEAAIAEQVSKTLITIQITKNRYSVCILYF